MQDIWKKLVKCIKKGNTREFFRELDGLSSNAALNKKDKKGRQLAHIAACFGEATILIELLKRGSNIESKCNKGNTILHYACLSHSPSCIVALLQAGASLTDSNIHGDYPCDLIPDQKKDLQRQLRDAVVQSQKKNDNMKKARNWLLEIRLKVDSMHGLKIIENGIHFEQNVILAKGPNVHFLKASFCSTNILLKGAANQVNSVNQIELSIVKEAVALRKMHHANILSPLGFFLQDAACAVIFEYPQEGFLHRLIFQSPVDFQLSSSDILNIGKCIANGLSYIHDYLDLVHSAIATFSVVMFSITHAKLCNFEHMTTKTATRSISHIPSLYPYMAMKQLQGCRADQQNDVHGLGIIMLECITRKKVSDLDAQNERVTYDRLPLNRLNYLPNECDNVLKSLVGDCIDSAIHNPTASQINSWLVSVLAFMKQPNGYKTPPHKCWGGTSPNKCWGNAPPNK